MQTGEVRLPISSGGTEAVPHAAHEALLVEAIIGLGDAPRAGAEIERSGDRGHATDQLRGRITQFAGQFEHHVTTERVAHQSSRLMAFAAELAQHRQQITGQSGVIERLAEVFRATARAHVEAVRREATA